MAIAFDNTTSTTTTGTSLSISHTMSSGTNGILFSFVFHRNTQTISAITYAGANMTLIDTFNISSFSSDYICSIYYKAGPATGANNVVVTLDSGSNAGVHNLSYTGASQTGIPDAIGTEITNNGTSVSTTGPTSIADNSWKILWVLANAGGTHSASTGATKRGGTITSGAQASIYDSNSAITPAGTYTIAASLSSSSNYVAIALTFSPAVFVISNLDTVAISEPALVAYNTTIATNVDSVIVTDSFSEADWKNQGRNTQGSTTNQAKSSQGSTTNVAKSTQGSTTNQQKS